MVRPGLQNPIEFSLPASIRFNVEGNVIREKMLMFALLPGTLSLCSKKRVRWTLSFLQEHWEHVRPCPLAFEFSFPLEGKDSQGK